MGRRVPTVLLVVGLLMGSCADDDGGPSTAASDTTVAPAGTVARGASSDEADGGGAGLQLGESELGSILVDHEGRSLYLFVPDAQGESTCEGACAATWPPVAEVAAVGEGLDEGLLGTTTRTDGTTQASYNGWPLYHYAGDTSVGDTNGQGLNDVWYVLDAQGEPVRVDASPTTTGIGAAPGY